MQEISLRSQILDNRNDSDIWCNKSIEVYSTPPQSPLKIIANEQLDCEYRAFNGSIPKKASKPSSISSPKKHRRIRTQLYQDIRFGAKYNKSCDRL